MPHDVADDGPPHHCEPHSASVGRSGWLGVSRQVLLVSGTLDEPPLRPLAPLSKVQIPSADFVAFLISPTVSLFSSPDGFCEGVLLGGRDLRSGGLSFSSAFLPERSALEGMALDSAGWLLGFAGEEPERTEADPDGFPSMP